MQPEQTAPAASPSRRTRLALGAAAIGAVALAASCAMPGQVTWSDAGATINETPMRLAVDPAVFVADQQMSLAGAMVAPGAAVTAHGVVRSGDEAVIASRMTALITALPLEAGQAFARGQLLASFDCSQMRAQLNAARAATAAYATTYRTNVELDAYKAIGTNEVAVSKANLGKATAEAQALAAGTDACEIRAPFAGTVVERTAHPHDVAASGQPLMKIQGTGALEVELIVPSKWLLWLKPGVPFDFALDETGGHVAGSIVRLGAAVDPVSRTMRVVGRIGSGGTVLPGMSGTARFVEGTAPVEGAGDGRTA